MTADPQKFPKLPPKGSDTNSEKTGRSNEIPIAARSKGPGPAAYTLPSTLGVNANNSKRAPAYSFGTKILARSPESTPGPNAFFPQTTRTGVNKGPAFSLQGGFKKGRIVDISTPGPGNYNPTFSSPNEPRAPAYSIGGREINDKANLTPGPAQYAIKQTLGVNTNLTMKSAAAYTIKPPRPVKLQSFSPGPAAYSALNPSKIKATAPAYSLGSRWRGQVNSEFDPFPEDGDGFSRPVPGPGHYSPNAKYSKSSPPNFSFRCKHSEFELFIPDVNEDGQILV